MQGRRRRHHFPRTLTDQTHDEAELAMALAGLPWEHWDRPRLLQYRGGHVSYLVEREVRDLLIEVFARTGLLDQETPEVPAAG